MLEDRRISAKSIAEKLGISRERVGSIIHEDLDMLVAYFLPGQAKDLSAPLYYDPSKRRNSLEESDPNDEVTTTFWYVGDHLSINTTHK
jgi:hypothetical protein